MKVLNSYLQLAIDENPDHNADNARDRNFDRNRKGQRDDAKIKYKRTCESKGLSVIQPAQSRHALRQHSDEAADYNSGKNQQKACPVVFSSHSMPLIKSRMSFDLFIAIH